MSQMARNLVMQCEDLGVRPRFLLDDRDALFAHDFDRTLANGGVAIVKTPFQAPNANAHAERWVRSVRNECLNHLVLCGLSSLQRTLHAYRDFHNAHRPHQGIRNQIPGRMIPAGRNQPAIVQHPPGTAVAPRAPGKIGCAQFLGGLSTLRSRFVAEDGLKSYSRHAA
jgi:transposase InsO family protein